MVKPSTCGSLGDQSHNLKDYTTPLMIHFDTDSLESDKESIYVQFEPNTLVNRDWVMRDFNKFKYIFCSDEKLLTLPNAKLFPYATSWINPNKKYSKEFGVSHLCSYKNQLPGHRLRHQVYDIINTLPYKKLNIRTPPRIESKEILFDGFQYSVIIENSAILNYFTEKIIDCLVSSTIPIYFGCTNIGDFFDDSYFLKFNNIAEFNSIIHNITPEFYARVIDKIEYNRIKALDYVDLWDRLNKELDKYYA